MRKTGHPHIDPSACAKHAKLKYSVRNVPIQDNLSMSRTLEGKEVTASVVVQTVHPGTETLKSIFTLFAGGLLSLASISLVRPCMYIRCLE